ncbi:MAG TPA: hypothetical protein VMC41_00050 [Candidatus Nanoarchaeia archaeon]|nr:hypothetical protein [Candidatus Nanoarchaeia archaeon]
MWEGIIKFIRGWKYNTHPERIAYKTRDIAMNGAMAAFNFFRDEKFRELSGFARLGEEEQNRIFNELTVTNLVLAILLLEQKAREENGEEKKNYLRALRDALPDNFIAYLAEQGIPGEFVEIWKKLIDLRRDEYAENMRAYRQELFAAGDKTMAAVAADNKLLIFQTVVFGLYDHIVRGMVKKDDPLYLYLQPYLLGHYKEFLKYMI